MYKVILFSGTSEGRILSTVLEEKGVDTLVCVATSYGAQLQKDASSEDINEGRLDENGIYDLLKKETPVLVIDATHPFAIEVSKNIKNASSRADINYLRVLREEDDTSDAICFTSLDDMIEYLNNTDEKILSTMGAKECAELVKVNDFANRLYVRMLPSIDGIKQVLDLGYQSSHLCCMQGPFTEDFNSSHLKQIGASILITKATGAKGGFPEKVEGAKKAGAKCLVLLRSEDSQGVSLEEAINLIKKEF